MAIRNQIADLVADNDLSDAEIIAFIETRYGAQVLLVPKSSGFDALVWVLPAVAFVCGLAALVVVFRRWKREAGDMRDPTDADRALVEAALLADVDDQDTGNDGRAAASSTGSRSSRRSAASCCARSTDLEREHDAGDVDDLDYQTLKDGYTVRAADVLREIEAGRSELPARHRDVGAGSSPSPPRSSSGRWASGSCSPAPGASDPRARRSPGSRRATSRASCSPTPATR